MGKKARERRHAHQDAATPLPARNQRSIWLALAAAAAAVIVYLRALHNPFVYDDMVTVVGNPTIGNLGNLGAVLHYSLFRPLVNLSYAFDFAFSGHDPLAFHLTSVLLHAANVVLLFLLARRLAGDAVPSLTPGDRDLYAVAASGLLALHPMMTEAVGYVSGRAEVLCAFFFLGSFLALRSFLLSQRRLHLVLGLAGFAFALAAKETAAMLPFALLTWDVLLHPRPGELRQRWRLHIPLLALVVVAAAGRVLVYLLVEHGRGLEDPWLNVLLEATVIWRYVGLLLVPAGQTLVHQVVRIGTAFDPVGLAALLGLAGSVWAALRLRRAIPLVAFGWLSFILLLLPSHLVPLREAMAEHRVYLASTGFFLAAACGFLFLAARARRRWPWIPGAVLLATLGGLGALTLQRLEIWSEPVRLWREAATRSPNVWAAQYGLADTLRAAGRCEEAVPYYRRAAALVPEAEDAQLNLGICLAQTGAAQEAEDAFLAAERAAPRSPKPHNNLAMLYMLQGRTGAAQDELSAALRLDPGNVRSRQLAAQLYELVLHDHARAAAVCEEIRAMAPDTPGVAECIARNRAALDTPR
jgi:protein O-mannosyl-transferase